MRDDDIYHGSARAARLAARHAWQRIQHALPFLREHPDVAEAVAEHLVASAGCSKEDSRWLSEVLPMLLPAARARDQLHAYWRRCTEDLLQTWRADPQNQVGLDDMHLWFWEKGLTTNAQAPGVLYLQRPSWGGLTALHISWCTHPSSRRFATRTLLVHYYPLTNCLRVAGQTVVPPFAFPTTPLPRMEEMQERIGAASGKPDWHLRLTDPFDSYANYYASPQHILALLALVRQGVDGAVADKAKADAAKMGIEVRQLAPDEYFVKRSVLPVLRDPPFGMADPMHAVECAGALKTANLMVFAEAHAIGALRSLKTLHLEFAEVDDVRMGALCLALAHGALPQLQALHLHSNAIADAGMEALAGALEHGALGQLTMLDLSANRVGDLGLRSLVRAIGEEGALPELRSLALDANDFGDEGANALAGVLAKGRLAALQTLVVGPEPLAALRDACGARGIHVTYP